MARSKSFDPAEKLEAAMYLFWRKGYEATSLENLETELNLKRFSIYNAFGDKLTLYQNSLKLYLGRYYYPSLRALTENACLFGIEQFFMAQAQFLGESGQNSGCFVFNATQEMEQNYAEIAELTQKAQAALLDAFTQALLEAKKQGMLADRVEPYSSARWLMTIYRGLVSSDTVENDKQWLEDFKSELQNLLALWQVDANNIVT